MENLTYINKFRWENNKPISNESFFENGILPDRFGSISKPSEVSIVSAELNAITQPSIIETNYQEIVLI